MVFANMFPIWFKLQVSTLAASVKSRSSARNNSSSEVFVNVRKTAFENPAKTLNDIDGESFPVSKFDVKS